MLALLLCAAFEYASWTAPVATGLAGVRLQNWRLARASPAQSASAPRFAGLVGYSRPFGLAGLDCGRVALAGRVGPLGLFGGVEALHLAGYSESDFHLAVGTEVGTLAVGTGLHLYLLGDQQRGGVVSPGFDIGARWRTERFAAGIDALRLNSPRLAGDELPARLVLSGSWQPVPQFAAMGELSRESGGEDAALSCEFRPVEAVGLRAGIAVLPMRYAAGIGVALSRFDLGYCYELNPAIGSNHLVELVVSWQ